MTTPARAPAGLDFVGEFARAAESFAETVLDADPRATVPTCPGWTVYDLVAHLGNVHAWAATIVETGRSAAHQNDEPGGRKARAVADWYIGKAEDLYRVLRLADPDAPCWNFAFDAGTASFWARRQVHETLVHGLDLAGATGSIDRVRSGIAPELAADGVDEALRVFGRRMHSRGHPAALSGPVGLVVTDLGVSWTVRPAPDARPGVPVPAPVVTDGAGAATDRVEGSASTLYALLWKRIPLEEADVTLAGDEDRVRAYLASRLTA